MQTDFRPAPPALATPPPIPHPLAMYANVLTDENRPAVVRFAESDMRRARNELRKRSEHGSILITETRRGLVDLAYNPTARTYSLISQDGGKYQFIGTASATRDELVERVYRVLHGEGSFDVPCQCGQCDEGDQDGQSWGYECATCERTVPFCFGAADSRPDDCDDCFAAATKGASN